MRRAENLTTFMCLLSWNLGASASWNPQGLSRPVMGLLCKAQNKKGFFSLSNVNRMGFCVDTSRVMRDTNIFCVLATTLTVQAPACTCSTKSGISQQHFVQSESSVHSFNRPYSVRVNSETTNYIYIYIYIHIYTVIPRLTKIIRSGITFVSRNLR